MADARETDAWITMADETRLAVTLYLPDDALGPQPCLLEALPYRKDDLTFGYRPEYARFRDEHGYAVARLDLRGTGSSGGRATDEYPAQEQRDLLEVIAWLADQPWCDGNVGMFGTSYSGFNSIQMACERPPALKAIVAIYATDDRYTDDVHYAGGALRFVDLIDYCHYMTPMNALPPVPEVWGDDWREEWLRRIDEHEPWLLTWLEHQRDGDYWRHGSLRPAYDRIDCAVMLVAGWADGYRNNSFRTMAALEEAGVPHRLLAGPWSHASPATAAPGPRIDLVPEMARWWDRWLRGLDNGVDVDPTATWFVREAHVPAPDLDAVPGRWRSDNWPPSTLSDKRLVLEARRPYAVRPDVGVDAWISCAGHLPWGQSLDQRFDDAASLVWEWDATGEEIAGSPTLAVSISVDQPVAQLSAKLCEVLPDGTSVLVTRGLTNLSRRRGMHTSEPMEPGRTYDVEFELEAAAWRFTPGNRIRLSVAGADWPNTVAPPQPLTMTVGGGEMWLPLAAEESPFPSPEFVPGEVASGEDADGVTWRVQRDVLARETSVFIDHGSSYETRFGTAVEHYQGDVLVDTRTFEQKATSTVAFTLHLSTSVVTTAADLIVWADAESFHVEITLRCLQDSSVVRERSWERAFPRDLT